MSTIKTKIDSGKVLVFLNENFAKNINSIETIVGGEISQGFFFSSGGKDYVIRINKKPDGFEKDRYAYKHFNSKNIPIPETLAMGKLDDTLHYSITERVRGKTMDNLDKTQTLSLVPSIIKTLDAIHNTPISNVEFGDWGNNEVAKNSSWNEHLLKFIDRNSSDIEKGRCKDFLEKDIIQKLTKKYLSLLDYCPEIKHLIHADFGFSNTLADGKKVTGVIDWANSKYGDFLYDVAWLSFWEQKIDYKNIFLGHYIKNNINIDNFEERILCYKLHFGIGSLFFFAKSDQEKVYSTTREMLLELIK